MNIFKKLFSKESQNTPTQEMAYVIFADMTLECLTFYEPLSQHHPEWLQISLFSNTRSPEMFNELKSVLTDPFLSGPDNQEVIAKSLNCTHAILLKADIKNPTECLENYFELFSILGICQVAFENIHSIFDMKMGQLYSSKQFELINAKLTNDMFAIQDHINIKALTNSEAPNECNMVTHGMIRFAKPEIVINNVNKDNVRNIHVDINELAERMIVDNWIPKHLSEVSLESEAIYKVQHGEAENHDCWGNAYIELVENS